MRTASSLQFTWKDEKRFKGILKTSVNLKKKKKKKNTRFGFWIVYKFDYEHECNPCSGNSLYLENIHIIIKTKLLWGNSFLEDLGKWTKVIYYFNPGHLGLSLSDSTLNSHVWVFSTPASNFPISAWCPAAAAKSLQSCPTLCDPIDGSPPASAQFWHSLPRGSIRPRWY